MDQAIGESYTWAEKRPGNGQEIEVFSVPLDKWFSATYWDDGVDGVFEFPDGDVGEVEEYGKDVITRWRP